MGGFNHYATYYNLLYKDKEYAKEAKQVDFLLKKYGLGKDAKAILNVGCGSGRHDVAFAQLGYQVTGIDQSNKMLEMARKTGTKLGIEYIQADARSFQVERKFDGAVSLFHVMSYMNGNEDVMDVFRSIRSALSPGGLFVFDTWYGPGVLTDRPSVRIKDCEDETSTVTRIAQPVMHEQSNLVDVNYRVLVMDKNTKTTSTIQEVHRMRYFFRPEIELMLGLSGFKLHDSLDAQTLKNTDFSSWTCYFVACAV